MSISRPIKWLLQDAHGLSSGIQAELSQVPKIRIDIATSGRFHLLDLARELDSLGADVRFYSYVSRKRASKFGLPVRCHVALLPYLFPFVALERVLPKFLPHTVERLMSWALDLIV